MNTHWETLSPLGPHPRAGLIIKPTIRWTFAKLFDNERRLAELMYKLSTFYRRRVHLYILPFQGKKHEASYTSRLPFPGEDFRAGNR